ncbi:MAG: redoxin family protein [Planctomycetia bacterium]|nr:redoxin family protein [Planctomycetia bacterium]
MNKKMVSLFVVPLMLLIGNNFAQGVEGVGQSATPIVSQAMADAVPAQEAPAEEALSADEIDALLGPALAPKDVTAAVEALQNLPEGRTPEALLKFAGQLNDPATFQTLQAFLQGKPEEEAMPVVEKILAAHTDALDLLLLHEKATAEQIIEALPMRLRFASQKAFDFETFQSTIEKRNDATLNDFVAWYGKLNALNDSVRSLMGGVEEPSEEDFENVLSGTIEFLKDAKTLEYLTPSAMQSLLPVVMLAEYTATPEVKEALFVALRDVAEKSSSEEIRSLKGTFDQKLAQLEAQKPLSAEAAEALLKELLTLPQNPTPENCLAFAKSFFDEEFGQKVTRLMQGKEEAEGNEIFAKLMKAHDEAVDFVLASDDSTFEQMKEAVALKFLNLSNKEFNTDDVKAAVAKKNDEKLNVIAQWYADLFENVNVLNDLRSAPQEQTQEQIQALLNKVFDSFGKIISRPEAAECLTTETSQMMLTPIMVLLYRAGSVEQKQAIFPIFIELADKSDSEGLKGIADQIRGELALFEMLGKPVALPVQTLDGKKLSMEDFKGKTVLVDVWATWCGPCVGEIPNMLEAYEKYHERGFEIVGLSIDEDREALEKFVAERKLPWVIVVDSDEEGVVPFHETFKVTGIPAMFLIDAEGKLISLDVRGKIMEELAKIYPDVADEAPAKEATEAIKSDAMNDTTSEAAEAKPSALEVLSKLPSEKTTDAMVGFIKFHRENTRNIFAEVRGMQEEEAIRTFEKIFTLLSEAADIILADANCSPEALQLAVETKLGTMRSLYMRDKAGLDAACQSLIDALKKRGAEKEALNVEVSQLMMSLQYMQRMPNTEEMDALLAKVAEFATRFEEQKSITRQTMSAFLRVISMADGIGGSADAINNACTSLQRALAASEDPQVASVGPRLAGIARRLTLTGNPMELVGVTLDGESVSLEDYKGKVVLVDFWATWCGPCVHEIANLEKVYEKYHDKGFEIVGFSLDHDMERLAKFLEERKLPWKVIVQKDGGTGAEDPAQYYGIMGIPCLILVDKDGNVISTKARGDVLTSALEEIFGE